MIIVTGGAGFIGSCLLWKLNEEGLDDILVVDHLDNSEKWKNLLGKKFRDYLEKDDFLDKINDNKFNNNIKTIFHLGALSSTTATDASYFIKNNFEYSKSLAKYAVEKKIRFIYASSAATYGDGSLGYSDDHEISLHLRPLNMYGFSKYLLDSWIIRNKIQDKVVGLKYFNVFGPNEYHKEDMQSVIAKSFQEVLDSKRLRLFKSRKEEYPDGEQKRDFIYVKDAVSLTYYFMENPDLSGIFNIGTGEAVSWNRLGKALFNALDIPVNIEYFDMPEHLCDKYQYFTQADMSKLKKARCSHNYFTIEDALVDYVNYLVNNSYL